MGEIIQTIAVFAAFMGGGVAVTVLVDLVERNKVGWVRPLSAFCGILYALVSVVRF